MNKLRKSVIIAVMSLTLLFSVSGCGSGTAGAQGPAGPAGAAGASVASATVNSSGHLILTMSTGQTIDAGVVLGPQGPAGLSGTSNGGAVSFASIIPQVEPKIVRIDCSVVGGLSSGSGTIVDARGYIVTNAHVINGATSIKVTLKDGSIFAATQVALDRVEDLAIIKLTSTRTDFPVMTLGSNSDAITGDPCMAGGFPMGTDLPGPATFTQGVISTALRVLDDGAGHIDQYIQIDAAINPGNSGGCLFNLSGKMLGIPTAGLVPPGEDFEMINLIISIDQVKAYIAANVK